MRNKLLMLVSALLLSAAGVFAQGTFPGNFQQSSSLHRVGGTFYALGYSTWSSVLISGNTSTGAGVSVVVYPGSTTATETLADGTPVPLAVVFNTNTPILVDIGQGNAEVVTPTSVSFGPCPGGNLGVGGSATCATVTGTFANTHGQSAIVTSGDFGIEEAITDAGNQGGGTVFWMVDTGIVTLSTGGATTTTTTKVPTQIYGIGAAARITTTVTTATTWSVGSTTGGAAIFCSSNSTMTAGTTCIANQVAPAVTGTTQALTTILFTFTGTPGAGAIKARVWGYTPVQASS
jgi:hypothetical protein